MPSRDFVGKSSYRFFGFFFIIVVTILIGSFINPIRANASISYEYTGGTCWLTYTDDFSGGEIRYSVASGLCSPGGQGACTEFANDPGDYCSDARVPGSLGTNCDDGGDIDADFTYDASGNATGYTMGATGCGASRNWSEAGSSVAEHLNIYFYDTVEREWRSIRGGPGGNQADYKIRNGNQSMSISLGNTGLHPLLKDISVGHAFMIWPNCVDRDKAINAGCFRTASTDPWVPPPPPMPVPQVDYTLSCTPLVAPGGSQYSTSVVLARNLNQPGYATVDVIDVSTYENAAWPNYWNAGTNGADTKYLPGNLTKTDTKTPLILSPSTTYWLRYYDLETGRHSVSRSFVTRAVCPAPSAPTITQAPLCRFPYPYEPYPADLMDLKWNRPSSLGTGFQGYYLEVSTTASSSGQMWYGSQSNDGSTVSNYTRFGSTVFGLSTGSSYYYRVRGYNWGGPGAWTSWYGPTLLRTRPTTPGNFTGVANNQTSPYIDLSWSYTNTAAAPIDVWGITRQSAIGWSIPAAQRSYRDTYFLTCNDTTHVYYLNAWNACGSGPIVNTSVFCPANKKPTCGVIQYRDNVVPWTNYPATGLTRNRSSTIMLRRTCSDPDQNGIIYSWVTSPGCGTFTPSVEILGTPSTSQTTYTFSSSYNTSCDLTSVVYDSRSNYAPYATVIAKTYPSVSGTHTLTVGTPMIRRSNTNDSYVVLGNVTQDKNSLIYSITNYSNPTAQGTNMPNRPGTLTINTTATNIDGRINICNPAYGTCWFHSNGLTSVGNITQTGTAHTIYVAFNSAQLANVKQVFLDPANTSPTYRMRVNFSSTSANGTAISETRDADPWIWNDYPYCAGVTFNPVSPVGSSTSSINISANARDDWGLKGISVAYAPYGSSTFTSIYSNANYFSGNPRAATTSSPAINWNISGLSTNRYQVRIQTTDLDGQTSTCWANSATGSENPTDGAGTLPLVFVDKTVPACTAAGLIITPNAAGTRLGFSVTGTDPGTANTASNLNSVALTYRYSTGTPSGTVASYIIPAPKPQTYTYTIANTAANAFNLDGVPSGVYTFTATWYDRANNSGSCIATYEKGSRISGKVNLYTGIDGATKRDYAYESTGTLFNPGTRPTAAGTFTGSTWQNAGGASVANCTATYPGISGVDTCTAYFVSNGTHGASSTPTVSLLFPTLSSDSSVGKYSCTMTVWRTFPAWTPIRTTSVPGVNGVCNFTLNSGEITVNPNGVYTTTSIWPTHVEFDLTYNSDQVYGQVMNETGSLVSGNTVTVGSSSPVTVSSGAYAAPAGNDSRDYPRTNANTTVTMNNSNLDRLCVWMAKNDFVNPDANLSRTTAANNFRSSNIGDVARSLASAGWNVGASALCSADVTLNRGPMTPKYQNQVNFINIPKVKMTGTIYYLKDDNQCGDPANWASNQETTLPPVPVNLSFSTSSPGDAVLDDFYNSDTANPADPTGAGSYNTGDTYTVYANALPGVGWDQWHILSTAIFPNPEYIICPSDVVVSEIIPDYPNPTSFTINAPIGVYVKETNDWWQAYNGGAHAQGTLTNAVPENEIAYGEIAGNEIHTLIGNPTFLIYQNAGSSIGRIDNSFRGFSSGGLVSSGGGLTSVPIGAIGDAGKAWLFVGAMQEMRIPYTTGSSGDELAAIRKIRNLTGSAQWNPSLDSLNGGGKTVFVDGDGSVNNTISYNGKKHLLINGSLDIDHDITASGGDYLLIVATDSVTIGSNVGQINASIYTSGDITIESAGQDSPVEKVLKVYGGLYAGGEVINGRDVQNIPLNYGLPSEQIIFNPALIIGSTESDFPSQLKESNTYWMQD